MNVKRTQLTQEILDGPEGPHIGAFFDLDRTLLSGYSVMAFMMERLLSGRMPPKELVEQFLAMLNFSLGRSGFSGLVSASSQVLRGTAEQVMIDFGEEVFDKHLAAAIFPESRALVQAHLDKGHTVAIVSSATPYQVNPVAEDLAIKHVLCQRLEVKQGVFTGDIIRPTVWGEGKLTAVRSFGKDHHFDLADSYFYTDAAEDLPLLEAVGKPRVVNPDNKLAMIAGEHNWPIRRYNSRGRPGIMDVVRTGLGYGAMVGSALIAGLPTWLLTGSSRQARNVTISTWGDVGAALTGITLNVEGEGHVWTHRPAIFIFNHQSSLDVLIGAKLLRRDLTGLAKKEVRTNPILGPFFAAAGIVFIDRASHGSAMKTLEPIVEAIESGISLGLAPEGTRSASNKLGPFKKGAFHMAMQTGVPIVPVVIINASDALPKGAVIIRPSTVDVKVLPPVMTGDWKPETIDEHIAEVRGMFLDALGQRDIGATATQRKAILRKSTKKTSKKKVKKTPKKMSKKLPKKLVKKMAKKTTKKTTKKTPKNTIKKTAVNKKTGVRKKKAKR
jgi:putative phosphoserine phosphatase/1-acylglycerol-3-phosphate O-acyltransferase